MIVYLDTSAMFKLYAAEPGANQVRRAVAGSGAIYTHLVAYAEMCAGFARAVKLGRIASAAAAGYGRELDRDWEEFSVLIPDRQMIGRAGDLAMRFGLRGYDSVHLAAAESLLAGQGKQLLHFASFERTLNQAAEAVGLQVLAMEG